MDYTTLIGCKVSSLNDIPNGLVGKHFVASNYNKFPVKGNLTVGNVIYEAWEKIWAVNLNRKYTTDFEVYGEKSKDLTNAELDIYIAIN